MTRKLIGAAATALIIAAGLGACQPKTQTASETATNTTITTTEIVPTSTASTDVNAVTVTATTGSAGNAAVTVPEMKPTGDLAPAVHPADPAKRSAGVAPQMAPTGNERLPYKEGATGK